MYSQPFQNVKNKEDEQVGEQRRSPEQARRPSHRRRVKNIQKLFKALAACKVALRRIEDKAPRAAIFWLSPCSWRRPRAAQGYRGAILQRHVPAGGSREEKRETCMGQGLCIRALVEFARVCGRRVALFANMRGTVASFIRDRRFESQIFINLPGHHVSLHRHDPRKGKQQYTCS